MKNSIVSRRGQTAVRAAAALVVLSTALAACGSSEDDSADAPSESADEYVATAQGLLDTAAESAVTGPSVGIVSADRIDAWDVSDMPTPSELTTDSVTVAVVNMFPFGTAPYNNALLQAIGEAIGWKVDVFQAATPDQAGALAAFNQAVLTSPDAIVGNIVPSIYVAPALEDARQKGIVTVALSNDSDSSPGYDAYVPASEGIQKGLLAAWAVAQSGGATHSLAVNSSPLPDANVPAASAFIKECETCTLDEVDLGPDTLTDPTKAAPAIAAAVKQGVDYVILPNGSFPLEGILNGVQSSRSRDAQLLVNNPGPGALQNLQDGVLPVVVDIPDALVVLTAIDNINRLLIDEPALADDSLRFPVSYFTPEDAPGPSFAALNAAELDHNDWLSPFETAWGVELKDAIIEVKD